MTWVNICKRFTIIAFEQNLWKSQTFSDLHEECQTPLINPLNNNAHISYIFNFQICNLPLDTGKSSFAQKAYIQTSASLK